MKVVIKVVPNDCTYITTREIYHDNWTIKEK